MIARLTMDVIKAGDHATFEFELDGCAQMFNPASVEAAFLFSESASPDDLKSALSKVLGGLKSFTPAAGRMVRRSGKVFVVCNDAGLPLTYEKRDTPAPSLGAPVAADFFDLVRDWVPTGEDSDELGDAPCRVKVTDFSDGQQLIALSVSHGLMDARSLGMLLSAWSAAFQDQAVPEVCHDHSVVPPVAFMTPLVNVDDIPDAWRAVWRPSAGMDVKSYSCAVTTYYRSAEACSQLKNKYAKEGMSFSTNDVLAGELAELLDCTKLCLIMEWRALLGVPNYFGVAITTLDFVGEAPASMPLAIRSVLPSLRNLDFVKWRLGAGMCALSEVMVNSWARAFDLADLRFKSAATDVMLGESICAARAKAFSGFGARYVLMLPQLSGIKICLWAPSEVTSKLQDTVLSSVQY